MERRLSFDRYEEIEMKTCIGLGTLLFVVGVILGLLQLWFAPLSAEIFLKIEMTIAAIFLVVLVVSFVVKKYAENKATKSGDRLDD